MKYLVLLILSCPALFAAASTHLELVEALEQGARTVAAGSVNDGVDQIFAQGAGNRLPKERAEEIQKFKSTLEEVKRLGSSRRVTRVSLLSFGDGYFRLRVLDRRSSGAILWTFVCERDDDRWYMTSSRLDANEQVGELLKEFDAADFVRDETKSSP